MADQLGNSSCLPIPQSFLIFVSTLDRKPVNYSLGMTKEIQQWWATLQGT
jgi:hypothetical protein